MIKTGDRVLVSSEGNPWFGYEGIVRGPWMYDTRALLVKLDGTEQPMGFYAGSLTVLPEVPEQTGIVIEAAELKMLREALCVAQSAISRTYAGEHRQYGQRYARRLAVVIERIDEARPLGSDGKHGSLHTERCGCEVVDN